MKTGAGLKLWETIRQVRPVDGFSAYKQSAVASGSLIGKIAPMPKGLLKPWSISTAVRNPDRLRGFLGVLRQLDGEEWNRNTQVSFQVRLIQARQYGAGKRQFYHGLTEDDKELIEGYENISYERAEEIFHKKNYEDPPMRGRNSFKPLEKFGFALIHKGRIAITDSGKALLEEQSDYGEIFLRALLKWQLPNPLERSFPASRGYNIKPFVGALRLIDEVNRICRKRGMKSRGLSRLEFDIFALTLIDWKKIGETAEEIVNFRQAGKAKRDEAERLRSGFESKHLRDYGDNALRYFRMTKYIRLRGWGTHVDLEPMRRNELRSLFKSDDAKPRQFTGRGELPLDDTKGMSYARFLADANRPTLPGESKAELTSTVKFLSKELQKEGEGIPARATGTVTGLKKQRDDLRARLQSGLRRRDRNRMQKPEQAETCINDLRSLLAKKQSGPLPPSLNLERLVTLGLDLMNDAENICPNYPLGDDGEPTSTAPAGKPDIECFYKNFAAICEVTMLRNRQQWMQEAQPVMRHLREFGETVTGKPCYCLFVAPSLHQDSLNIFHYSVKAGYEGEHQRIVPLALKEFCDILDFFRKRAKSGDPVKSRAIKSLFDSVSNSLGKMKTSDAWRRQLPQVIEEWKRNA